MKKQHNHVFQCAAIKSNNLKLIKCLRDTLLRYCKLRIIVEMLAVLHV